MKFKKILCAIIFVMLSFSCANAFAQESTVGDGLLIHYDFEKENIILNDDETYTIKDISGNGYDATSIEYGTFGYFEVIDSISKQGTAVCGSLKLENKCFENIGSSYTINFIGEYIWALRPIALINLAGNMYTTAWGSGIGRYASYFENGERVGFRDYAPTPPSKINMYTFICNDGEINMYLNGVQITEKFHDRTASAVLSELAQNPDNEFTVQNLYLDEFRLYNRALTENEITELLNKEIILQINNADWAEGKLTANMTLNTFLPPFCECILVAYDADDKLISTSVHKMMSESAYVGDLQMDCSEEPAYIKLFIWNSTFGMKPQFEPLQYQM